MKKNNTHPVQSAKKFLNPHIADTKRKWFHYFLWQIGYYDDPMPPPKMPKGFRYPNPPEEVTSHAPTITWINHCSFLIIVDGITILTDPIWSHRCSPVSVVGPKRKHQTPIPLDQLPPIDVVLISHNHYDHLDKKTVLELHRKYPNIQWVVPKGVKQWFIQKKILRTQELSWWDSFAIPFFDHQLDLKITAVPSQHFSGRGIFDLNKSLWCGFVVEMQRKQKENKKLYFVGDTGYNPNLFREIGKEFGKMDLSLIPIGTYVPNRFMAPVHIDPESAVSIHQEVNSKLSVGMHWYTFRLSEESQLQPTYDLFLAMKQAKIDPLKFRAIFPGQVLNW